MTREEVWEAARTVDADRFIRRLPDGYQTEVSEKGANFSRGERQLLSFARALAVNPDLLILDEATSSVDPETERTIQAALQVFGPRMVGFTIDYLKTDEVPGHWLASWVVSAGASLSLSPGVSFALGFIVLGLFTFSLYAYFQSWRAWMNTKLEWLFRQDAFDRITSKGPDFFNRFRTGDLVTRMTDDVAEKLSWFACSGIFRLYEALLYIVFIVCMMASIDAGLTLWTAGPLPLLILIFFRSSSILDRRYDRLQRRISAVSINRLMELEKVSPMVRDQGTRSASGDVRGEIRFEDIDFAFPGSSRKVIDGAPFDIDAGQTIALVGKPKILILDDCTSALDSQTETALWDRLHVVMPGMTAILITHRPDTLQQADRIFVLQRGTDRRAGTAQRVGGAWRRIRPGLPAARTRGGGGGRIVRPSRLSTAYRSYSSIPNHALLAILIPVHAQVPHSANLPHDILWFFPRNPIVVKLGHPEGHPP